MSRPEDAIIDMSNPSVPTLYEWAGGLVALNRLTTRFYEHVNDDPRLAPIFAHMSPDHPAHVAAFLAEVLGGPTTYSEEHGGHPHMIQQHLNRHLTQEQRRRWVALLLETADELKLPEDPEFRSALVGYLEWGSRLAVINSQPGSAADPHAPMPKWGVGGGQGAICGVSFRSPMIRSSIRALLTDSGDSRSISGMALVFGPWGNCPYGFRK